MSQKDLPFRRAEVGGGLDQAVVEAGGEDEHDEEREGQGPDDVADQDRPEAELEAEEGAEKKMKRRGRPSTCPARNSGRKREEDDAAGIAGRKRGWRGRRRVATTVQTSATISPTTRLATKRTDPAQILEEGRRSSRSTAGTGCPTAAGR